MHFSFSSKMGWFPVYLWFNIDYHGFIDLSNLSFVYPKSEFRPSKHQKSPLTTALSRPGDHVQKGHGKCIGKAGATIRVQSDLSDHFLKGWHLGSKFCQMLAYGRRGCDDYFMGGRIVPTFFWRSGRHFTFAELNMSSLKGNEWHRVLTNHQTS